MYLKNYNNRQLIKQYLYRYRYNKFCNIKLLLKLIIKNKYIEKQFKVLAIFYIVKLPKLSVKSYHKNICLRSSNKRSVLNFFKLNRLMVSDNVNNLIFPGINKAV